MRISILTTNRYSIFNDIIPIKSIFPSRSQDWLLRFWLFQINIYAFISFKQLWGHKGLIIGSCLFNHWFILLWAFWILWLLTDWFFCVGVRGLFWWRSTLLANFTCLIIWSETKLSLGRKFFWFLRWFRLFPIGFELRNNQALLLQFYRLFIWSIGLR
jgi:hypothetical protein